MPEITPEQLADLKMYGGIALVGLVLGWSKISPYLTKALNYIKPSKTAVTSTSLADHGIHDILEFLIKNRTDAKDDEGIMLVSAVGIHLYKLKQQEGGKQ